MKNSLLRMSGLLVFAGIAACGDITTVAPIAPTMSVASATRSVAAEPSGEIATISPYLAQLNDELDAAGSDIRNAKAELLMDGNGWDGVSSTIVIANDRFRGIGAEWVPGDPRRAGRIGVNYQVRQALQPTTRDPDGSNVRLVPFSQLDTQIEEGMQAWRDQGCSAPITRVPVSNAPTDIYQLGWFPKQQFWAIAGGDTLVGNRIIGVTLSAIFVDAVTRVPTDIDRNGKADLGRSQILYNNRFYWGATAAPNVVDFYSIITHETGHGVGLGHFGKVFANAKDLNPNGTIPAAAIKYAPLAIMNAVYVTGRGEIRGTDHSSFCQIWASAK